MIQNVEIAQFIAYICLTLTSVIVSTVSLRFSYRQNFGWRPILLVSSHGLKSSDHDKPEDATTEMDATLKFEVWNRHSYPIVIESAGVRFYQVLLDSNKRRFRGRKDWYIRSNGQCFYRDRSVVKNGEHFIFDLSAPMKPQSLDGIDDNLDIQVQYFDPRRNRHRTLAIKYRYHFKARQSTGGWLARWWRGEV